MKNHLPPGSAPDTLQHPVVDIRIFEAMPGNCVLVQPDAPFYTVLAVTQGMLDERKLTREATLHRPFSESFGFSADHSSERDHATDLLTLASLEKVLQEKQPHRLTIVMHEECSRDGVHLELSWTVTNKPILDAAGCVQYIIHTIEEVPGQVRSLAEHLKTNVNEGSGIDATEIDETDIHTNAVTSGSATPDESGMMRPPVSEDLIRGQAGTLSPAARVVQNPAAPPVSVVKDWQSALRAYNIMLQAPVAMCILKGSAYEVELVNNQMLKIWGIPGETILHEPLFDSLPEAREQGLEALLHQVYQTGQNEKASEIPINLPRAGIIETRYFNFLYEALFECTAEVSGIMVTAIDVTDYVLDRQRMEGVVARRSRELGEANASLQHSAAELKRSSHNLEEFAHAASHDLKEPIRKIHFFTSRLKAQLEQQTGEQELKTLTKIERATERMKHLIDDMLIYSNVSLRLHQMEAVDLNKNLQQVLEDVELDIQEKKAIIHVAQLPVVKGYNRQLQQLFQNFITNALKYSRKDLPPQIVVTASVTEKGGQRYHLVEVTDNGIGFEQEHADKIFQMFARLHSNNEYSGTGVGLSIVKKVVENHRGLVEVESVPGVGSIFKVYLPAQPGGRDRSKKQGLYRSAKGQDIQPGLFR